MSSHSFSGLALGSETVKNSTPEVTDRLRITAHKLTVYATKILQTVS